MLQPVTLGRVRRAPLLLVVVCCSLLVGCGSATAKFAGTWSQKGSTFHAFWNVPSASSIDLQLTGATSVTSCKAISKGRSETSTILIVEGAPAAYFAIGKTLRAGTRVQTTCQVAGTVQAVSFGTSRLRHLKGR